MATAQAACVQIQARAKSAVRSTLATFLSTLTASPTVTAQAACVQIQATAKLAVRSTLDTFLLALTASPTSTALSTIFATLAMSVQRAHLWGQLALWTLSAAAACAPTTLALRLIRNQSGPETTVSPTSTAHLANPPAAVKFVMCWSHISSSTLTATTFISAKHTFRILQHQSEWRYSRVDLHSRGLELTRTFLSRTVA